MLSYLFLFAATLLLLLNFIITKTRAKKYTVNIIDSLNVYTLKTELLDSQEFGHIKVTEAINKIKVKDLSKILPDTVLSSLKFEPKIEEVCVIVRSI